MAAERNDPTEADWYKDAVIYEVHVRAFGDSDGDGVGDFPGLTARLDHLQRLGVTAIWLLPFYPSPLRDDGYDIADYTNVNPLYGNLRDFKELLEAAHDRGLRVITELVLNHTSDQHPWFQRSRRSAPGTSWRDFYVWSDTPDRYPGVRIIFEDTETSNWQWDAVAGAYYWHRFFAHQPDLNYDNPEVRATMLRVVDQWFDLGVDGVRLDAVPYLFEREGTNCENLPETHAFLKELRAHVDARYPGRMLLGEANQWPEDAVAYFGEGRGDECHMAFHFPIMPRLFMGLRMEDRHPIIDILSQTPDIPETAQWATFLRNHDELTLEMVTDEERDYMYRTYAADPQARINVGIRRRLAPLLQRDRRKIELMNGLLFALPGTPVIYYGDELGMGDNVYLGDRDAVRTPMQWSPDRNAGFSVANPQQLYLPVIIDPEFHYETVNVEAQERNPSSLLNWMRRTIALRQHHRVFGRGDITFLYPENAKVLAFVRSDEHERILVVANLSRYAQSVTLDLHEHRGAVPVELFGGSRFPQVAEGGYNLTLGPHGFYWFALDSSHLDAIGAGDRGQADVAELSVKEGWSELIQRSTRRRLQRVLPAFLQRNRWYAGRARDLRGVEVADAIPIGGRKGRPGAWLTIVHAEYDHGEAETYVVPLTVLSEYTDQFLVDHPDSVIAWVTVESTGQRLLLVDAMAVDGFVQDLRTAVARNREVEGTGSRLTAWSTQRFRRIVAGAEDLTPTRIIAEQSNSSVIFGNRLVVKLFRRAQEGVNPELEIGRYLTEEAGFEHTAPLVGAIEWRQGRSEPRTIAVVNEYVANEGDAWHYTLDSLSLFYESALESLPESTLVVPSWSDMLAGQEYAPTPPVLEAIGPYLDSAEQLGRRTAELHDALAAATSEDFEPEPFTSLYQRSLYQSLRTKVRPTMDQVRRMLPQLEDREASDAATALLAAEDQLMERFGKLRGRTVEVSRIRVHGDLHLGQVLLSGRDWIIIDFEGEPSRSPTERRIKRSALVDVAGMMRSFQYAAEGALRSHIERGVSPVEDREELARRGDLWQRWVTNRYLAGYLSQAEGRSFVPARSDDVEMLLRSFVLEKALYEVRYDLAHRPHWAGIPMSGILELLED